MFTHIYLMLWAIFLAILSCTVFLRDNMIAINLSLILSLVSLIIFIYYQFIRKEK